MASQKASLRRRPTRRTPWRNPSPGQPMAMKMPTVQQPMAKYRLGMPRCLEGLGIFSLKACHIQLILVFQHFSCPACDSMKSPRWYPVGSSLALRAAVLWSRAVAVSWANCWPQRNSLGWPMQDEMGWEMRNLFAGKNGFVTLFYPPCHCSNLAIFQKNMGKMSAWHSPQIARASQIGCS